MLEGALLWICRLFLYCDSRRPNVDIEMEKNSQFVDRVKGPSAKPKPSMVESEKKPEKEPTHEPKTRPDRIDSEADTEAHEGAPAEQVQDVEEVGPTEGIPGERPEAGGKLPGKGQEKRPTGRPDKGGDQGDLD